MWGTVIPPLVVRANGSSWTMGPGRDLFQQVLSDAEYCTVSVEK